MSFGVLFKWQCEANSRHSYGTGNHCGSNCQAAHLFRVDSVSSLLNDFLWSVLVGSVFTNESLTKRLQIFSGCRMNHESPLDFGFYCLQAGVFSAQISFRLNPSLQS